MYDLNPPGHCGPHLPSAGVNQHSSFEVNEESNFAPAEDLAQCSLLFQGSTDIPEE